MQSRTLYTVCGRRTARAYGDRLEFFTIDLADPGFSPTIPCPFANYELAYTGESVNCKRTRTQTTSRSICSFAVIGRERLRVCPARPGTRAANKSADWLITPSVLSLHRTLIWPSTVLYLSGTGEFSELRRPPAEISILSFLRCACENSLLIGREVGTTMSIFIVKGSICQTIFCEKRMFTRLL